MDILKTWAEKKNQTLCQNITWIASSLAAIRDQFPFETWWTRHPESAVLSTIVFQVPTRITGLRYAYAIQQLFSFTVSKFSTLLPILNTITKSSLLKSLFWLAVPKEEPIRAGKVWQPGARMGSWDMTSSTANTKQRVWTESGWKTIDSQSPLQWCTYSRNAILPGGSTTSPNSTATMNPICELNPKSNESCIKK